MTLSTYDTLKVERHGPVGWLINNRPERLNAMSSHMRDEFADAWLELDADPAVKVIVHTGEGRAFQTGVDVEEIASDGVGMERYRESVENWDLHFTAWQQGVDKPVITAVNGICAGGAFHWVAEADIVIAASDAQFFDPHVSVGQVVAVEAIALLRKMPFEAVMRMALVGRYERMSAARAYELGMISQIVDPPDQLRDEAQKLAETIAKNSPAAMRATKRALWGALESGLTDGVPERRAGAGVDVGSPGPGRRPARVLGEARAEMVGARSHVSASLADVLEPRDDDATTIAVYTTTEEVTRAELRVRAESLAAVLRDAGLRPGQAVGVMLPNGPDIVAALFGIWFAGGVYIPVNPRLSADELAHVFTADRPAALITRADEAGRALDVPVVLATGDGTWRATGALDAAAPALGPEVAAISFTSGTTGRPKPVPLLHANVLGLMDGVLNTLRGGGGTPGPRKDPMPNLIPTSLSLWAGIYNVIFGFRAGAAVIIMDRFDTHAFADFVERFQLRSTVLPPAAMTMLADDDSITTLAPLKYVRSITAPLSPLQARRFRDRFGISVLNGWGQTEIGGEIVGWSAQDAKEFGDSHLGAVGRAHENVGLDISDDGEILVQTPTILARAAEHDDMDGRLVDGWFHTGDLGRVDAEGFLWIEGRVSDMINRGGLKVFPEEVAEVIRLSPDVIECAVAGIPDDRLGEVPWAFVVLRDGATLDADALTELCRAHLAPYKVPARFESIAALPRNEVGKVLLRELVARAAAPR